MSVALRLLAPLWHGLGHILPSPHVHKYEELNTKFRTLSVELCVSFLQF